MNRLQRPLLTLAALAALLALAACSGDDDPTTAPAVWNPKVLVLADNGTEDHVLHVLGAAGADTTRGGLWYEDQFEDVYLYDVVVLLNGVDYSHLMSDVAMARLVQFVAAGGGLITTEWLTYYAYKNAMLTDILPVVDTSDYDYDPETLRPSPTHPLAAGLPDSLTTGPDWSWITLVPDTTAAKNAQVAVTGDFGGPAVVTGTHGNGRTVSWGMAGTYDGDDIWTPGVEQLLTRIVTWAAGG